MTTLSPHVDWSLLDTVLLDMDGTLLDLHYDNYFWREYLPQAISARDGANLEAAKDAVLPRLRQALGTLEFYCIDYWSEAFELDILALKKEVAHKIAVRDGAVELLEFLRAEGKTVVLATNAHSATIDLKMEKTGLHHHFDIISCSHQFGHAKEHTAYWPAFASAHGVDLSRALFIDDTPRVLTAAHECGVARVFGVRTPDSQRPPLPWGGFPQTDNFRELF